MVAQHARQLREMSGNVVHTVTRLYMSLLKSRDWLDQILISILSRL